MNVGPPRIAMIIATSAATRTLAISGQVLRDDLESHRARALDEHDVAGPERGAQRAPRRSAAVRDPVAAVRAREPADRDHVLDPELAHERRRSPGGTRARSSPSSAISPSTATRRRPLRALGQVLERGAHRDRVRVVAVVQEQAAAGELRSSSRSFENSTCSSSSGSGTPRRRAAATAQCGCSRADAAPSSSSRTAAARSGSTRSTMMSRAVEVRLEQRLVRDDRDTAGRQRRDQLRLRRATFSIVSTSSRCTGPTFVITPMSGLANDASYAIWPSPRIPSSAMQISVSGSSRASVSGTPSSLL